MVHDFLTDSPGPPAHAITATAGGPKRLPGGLPRLTSEIALMNRYAVVLAADSAVTTTYWQGGRKHTRYFKGANKIFSLSSNYPVGAMIYDAANLQGVPWEIIIKAYRDNRGDKPHDELKGYAADLFDFIATDGHLFPREHQEKHFISSLVAALGRVTFALVTEAKDDAEIKARFESLKKEVAAASFLDSVDHNGSIKEAERHKEIVLLQSADDEDLQKSKTVISEDKLFELAATVMFKQGWTTLETSGLVFAGFGQNQYFPEMLHFNCYGVCLGKVLKEPTKSRSHISVGPDNTSAIEPLAQSEMVETFMYGASPAAIDKIGELFLETMDQFEKGLVGGGHLKADADLDAIRADITEKYSTAITQYLHSTHTQPLRRVIGMLSVTELAELAETLIAIESLKERVTKPTESVSGPVDVAVISKSDGFIWIKRKHYFERELNPRFFARNKLTS